jgi:hypothetical protein
MQGEIADGDIAPTAKGHVSPCSRFGAAVARETVPRLKQTRNQKDGLPAQDAHRSVKVSADAVDSCRRPPDPRRALREPVSVCNRTSLSHG